MLRRILRLVLLACPLLFVGANPSAAGSAIIDLSKPQTGMSKDVLDHNLKPVPLGVVADGQNADTPALSGTGCRQACSEVERPVHVRSYTRQDGTFVQGHTRVRPGSSRN
jgi:hypothetical protein